MTALRLQGVSKAYRVGGSPVLALREASLEIAAGEMVALTGPSGSGKSTLLNLCGLVDTPDAGSREVDGVSVDRFSASQLTALRRERIGFIFQGFNLVPVMSAYENVEYPLLLLGTSAAERKRKVSQALERVGLGALGGRLPDALSGGQRQRVAIARALVKAPAVVIADEPTGNLDSATAMQVVDLLRELTREQGAAAVVATHDDRMTEHCDRAVRLKDGVIQ